MVATTTAYYGVDQLSQGTYTFHIEDSEFCHKIYKYELYSDYFPQIEESTMLISHSCEGLPNGEIGFVVFPFGGGASSYDFQWSSGVTQLDQAYTYIGNLSPGNYEVTITDVDHPSCKLIRAFTIENGMSSDISLTTTYTNNCPGENDGYIDIVASSGIAPYYLNGSAYSDDGNFHISNLQSGTYCYTITDQCEEVQQTCISLSALQASHTVTPDCADMGSATILGVYGNPPYSYMWPDGETTTNVYNKATGDYDVTITDSRGCDVIHSVPIYNRDYEIIESVLPCEGEADGQIIVRIYNPLLESAYVLYNGLTLPFDGDQIIEEVAIGGLEAEQNIEFELSIGPCTYEEGYTMDESPSTHEFVRSEDYVCIYDIVCKGNTLVEEGYEQDVVYKHDLASGGGWSTCAVPYFCGSEIAGVDFYRTSSDKALTYLKILEEARLQNLFNEGYIDILIDYYHDTKKLEPCHRVRYCPANLEIVSVYKAWGGISNSQIRNGNGCLEVDCKFPVSDFEICYPESYPDYFQYRQNGGPGDPISCDPVSINLYKMYVWSEQINSDPRYLDYENSFLRQFVLQHGPEPYSTCVNITFCLSNFEVLGVSNGSMDIDCTDIYDPNTSDYIDVCGLVPASDINPNLHWTVCRNPNVNCDPYADCAIYKMIDLEYRGLERNGTASVTHLVTPESDLIFDNYIQVVGDGITYKKGIFKNDNENKYFYDYGFNNSVVDLKEIGDICGVVEDWDDNSTLFLECVSNNSTIVHFENEITGWNKNLLSDSELEIINIQQDNQVYSCLFRSKGKVLFGDEIISDNTTSAVQKVQFDKYGAILSVEWMEGNIENGDVLLWDANGAHCRVLLNQSTSGFNINGQQRILNSNERALVSLCNSEGPEFYSKIWKSNSMKISDCAVSRDGMKTFVTLIGSGRIKINGVQIFRSNNIYGVVVVLDNTGQYLSKKVMGASGIVNDQIRITAREDGTQYIAFTLDQQRVLGGQTLYPEGGSDIVLAGLSNAGVWYDIDIYGSPENEILGDIEMTTDHVFISGYADRGAQSRVIGDIELFSTNIESDYSFLVSKAIGGQSTQSYSIIGVQEDRSEFININVHPTLVEDKIEISINDSQNLLYDEGWVISSFGAKVKKLNVFDYKDNNTILDVSSLASGVYFILFMDKHGKSYKDQFIKLN